MKTTADNGDSNLSIDLLISLCSLECALSSLALEDVSRAKSFLTDAINRISRLRDDCIGEDVPPPTWVGLHDEADAAEGLSPYSAGMASHSQ